MSEANPCPTCGYQIDRVERINTENARLRRALQKIVDEADSDDGLTAWDGGDIARDALEQKVDGKAATPQVEYRTVEPYDWRRDPMKNGGNGY